MTDIYINTIREFDRSVKDLYASFPHTFKYAPSIAVSIGWHGILADFASELEPVLARWTPNKNESLNDRPYLDHVKEKFGELRMLVNGRFSAEDNEFVNSLIRKYSNMSLSICESCGRPGSISKKGWMSVACDLHR